MLRPFYFIVVLWGERFRDYFVAYCVPSLLAPDNIPSLINKQQNKFLICTTLEDWAALSRIPIFSRLKEFITVELIEIPAAKAGVSGCVHMGIGHKIATDICHRDKAYGIALTPDLLISNGTLKAVQQHALAGKQIVYCAAVRFAEEPLFDQLHKLNITSEAKKFSDTAEPLVASGRELVRAGVPSFHSETMTYNFDAPYFASSDPAAPLVYWPVPEDGGVLIHSMSWCPLLLDYGIVESHNTDTFDTWTFDGDYVYKNFAHSDRVHICTDSDEMMLVSWAPLSDRPRDLTVGKIRARSEKLKRSINGLLLRAELANKLYDPMKLKIFPIPVYWHTKELTPAWKETEARAKRIINHLHGWDGKVFNFLFNRTSVRYLLIILKALFGNKKAWQRIMYRLTLMKKSIAS